ncbi:hypothetical protein FB451DRAFT_1164749 [Mycena latifolia]|nr:hypothetical protein FB451DRAFT_1164749 [Mycena latifolia]
MHIDEPTLTLLRAIRLPEKYLSTATPSPTPRVHTRTAHAGIETYAPNFDLGNRECERRDRSIRSLAAKIRAVTETPVQSATSKFIGHDLLLPPSSYAFKLKSQALAHSRKALEVRWTSETAVQHWPKAQRSGLLRGEEGFAAIGRLQVTILLIE